jgi:hypothetical protein
MLAGKRMARGDICDETPIGRDQSTRTYYSEPKNSFIHELSQTFLPENACE